MHEIEIKFALHQSRQTRSIPIPCLTSAVTRFILNVEDNNMLARCLLLQLHLTPHNACPGPCSVDTRGPGWRLLDPETMSPMVCCVCSQDIAGTRITWCTTADIMT